MRPAQAWKEYTEARRPAHAVDALDREAGSKQHPYLIATASGKGHGDVKTLTDEFERLSRTAKDRLGLVLYASPEDLPAAVARFVAWYNHERYHEARGNMRPADVCEGRADAALARRKDVQRRAYEQRRRWNLRLHPQPT